MMSTYVIKWHRVTTCPYSLCAHVLRYFPLAICHSASVLGLSAHWRRFRKRCEFGFYGFSMFNPIPRAFISSRFNSKVTDYKHSMTVPR